MLWVRSLMILGCFSFIATTGFAQAKHTSIYAMDSDGKNVREVISLEDYPSVGSPDVSPDGKRLAFDGWRKDQKTGDAQLFIVDIETGQIQHVGPGAMPTWSADGKYLAYSSYKPHGVFIRSADGVATKLIDAAGWGIQWSPDGQKLAYVVGGDFVIYDILTDKKRTVQPNPAKPYTYIYYNSDWSPDSKKLCFRGRRPDGGYDTAIIDVSGENSNSTSGEKPKLTVCFDATKGYSNEFAWHPDGDRILLFQHVNPPQLAEFKPEADVTTTLVEGQPKDRANVAITWSLDGKTLYFMSKSK